MQQDPSDPANAANMRHDEFSREEVAAMLRSAGCSKVDSIRIIVRHTSLSIAQAKELVHFSNAWSDTRGDHDAVVNELDAASRLLAEEDDADD